MKKIVLSIIVALIAITANAQVYVGGTFGVGSDKVETEGTEVKNTTFKILPEVGYELNEDRKMCYRWWQSYSYPVND